jgi:hypothetical protein
MPFQCPRHAGTLLARVKHKTHFSTEACGLTARSHRTPEWHKTGSGGRVVGDTLDPLGAPGSRLEGIGPKLRDTPDALVADLEE